MKLLISTAIRLSLGYFHNEGAGCLLEKFNNMSSDETNPRFSLRSDP